MSRRFIIPWLFVVMGLMGTFIQVYDPTSTLGQGLTRTGLILTVSAFITLEITERAKGQKAICEKVQSLEVKVDNATLICYYGGRADTRDDTAHFSLRPVIDEHGDVAE